MTPPVIISLSPREGGNSDAVADLYARSLAGPSSVLRLREYQVVPCTGCGACARDGVCVYSGEDEVEDLFARLDLAGGLVLTAPVYFYHLPAMAKAWIDRAQSRYMARESGVATPGSLRPAYAVLCAARDRGENLFAGIMPTLKYFLQTLDFHLEDSLHLRGIDAVGDFRADRAAVQAVKALAARSGW